MQRTRGSIVAGIILIVLGGWLMAERLGVRLPGLENLWPGFIVALGLFSFADFFTSGRADTGKIWFGVAATLVGGFFFLFTLGRLTWREDMQRYWPVFVLIASLAFFVQWLFTPARRGLLVPASLTLLVGGFFLAANLNIFSPVLTRQVISLWPLILIVLGLLILVRAIARKPSG